MIFQIYDLLAPLVAKARTARYGEGKAESRNLNMKNRLPRINLATEEAVKKPLLHFYPNRAMIRPHHFT